MLLAIFLDNINQLRVTKSLLSVWRIKFHFFFLISSLTFWQFAKNFSSMRSIEVWKLRLSDRYTRQESGEIHFAIAWLYTIKRLKRFSGKSIKFHSTAPCRLLMNLKAFAFTGISKRPMMERIFFRFNGSTRKTLYKMCKYFIRRVWGCAFYC